MNTIYIGRERDVDPIVDKYGWLMTCKILLDFTDEFKHRLRGEIFFPNLQTPYTGCACLTNRFDKRSVGALVTVTDEVEFEIDHGDMLRVNEPGDRTRCGCIQFFGYATGFISQSSCFHCFPHGDGHFNRVLGTGDAGVHQHTVTA